MSQEGLRLEDYVEFHNDHIFGEVMQWAVDEIFQKIWIDEEWNKCAKGGRHKDNPKFERHNDMSYPVHIFSGTVMVLKIFDYMIKTGLYNKNDYLKREFAEADNIRRLLKRSILGYTFHDYNKITGTDYHMRDRESLLDLLRRHFTNLTESIGMTEEDIYQIAICTEKGTTANVLDSKVNVSNLDFEMNFSRLADSLSGNFNEASLEKNMDIRFGPYILIPHEHIKSVSISSTNLFALEDIAKKALVKVIKNSLDGFYLWSSGDTIYYVIGKRSLSDNEVRKQIISEFSELISIVMRPNKLIKMNDRRIDNSASGYVSQTRMSICEFMRDEANFKMCLHLMDIQIEGENIRNQAEKFTDFINQYENSLFQLNFKFVRENSKPHSIREGLKISNLDEAEEKELIKIFVIRYLQLSSTLKTENTELIRKKIEIVAEDLRSRFGDLLGKDPEKSALIVPVIMKDDLNWEALLNDVIKDMNGNSKAIDYETILQRIIPSLFVPEAFPDVPEKSEISLVNGYPSQEIAKGERLYGINTNGFNNRLKTSRISNGKVDDVSILENNVRRTIMPKRNGEETLIYLKFPGAIPHMDLTPFINKVSSSKTSEKFLVDKLNLSLDNIERGNRNLRVDDAFFFSTSAVKKEEDVLRILMEIIEIAEKTKMNILVTYSNSPIISQQRESIKIDISSSIISFFSWNTIRCNEISKVRKVMEAFSVVTNGSLEKMNFKDMQGVITQYIQCPMSIFKAVHDYLFKKNEEGKNRSGFGKQFPQRIYEIRRLGYSVEKEGDRKMKNIEKLATIGSQIIPADWKMSGNERTWMLRDTLEALEVARVKVKNGEKIDLEEFRDVIGGVLLASIRREFSKDGDKFIPMNKIGEFTDSLIKLLKEDFEGRIPSGSMKSYLINAFEFEYMLTGEKNKLNREKIGGENEQ